MPHALKLSPLSPPAIARLHRPSQAKLSNEDPHEPLHLVSTRRPFSASTSRPSFMPSSDDKPTIQRQHAAARPDRAVVASVKPWLN